MTRKKVEGEVVTVAVPPAPPTDVILTTAVKSGNMELYAEWKKRQFLRAFAAAQAELPTIIKDREVDYVGAKGRVNYKYEDLANMLTEIRPILSSHGLSIRFETATTMIPEGGKLDMTVILAHEDGHEAKSQLSGYWEGSGGKNSIQAQGSTGTYLQRQLTKSILGFASAYDDDGRATSKDTAPDNVPLIAPEQVAEIEKALAALPGAKVTKEQFLERAYPELKELADIPADSFADAMGRIAKAAERRRNEIVAQ